MTVGKEKRSGEVFCIWVVSGRRSS